MSIYDLFSKRGRSRPPTLSYDSIPQPFRAQAIHVIADGLGMSSGPSRGVARGIGEVLLREHPIPTFRIDQGDRWRSASEIYVQYIWNGSTDECLDAIELSLRILNKMVRDQQGYYLHALGAKQSVDECFDEINNRFLDHGLGYQFSAEENQLVRMDSELLHREAVEPAMRLLQTVRFEGPAQEFATAHQHHRSGDGKDALAWAVKAVESACKAICEERGWAYAKTDTIAPLLKLVEKKGLVPANLESFFTGVRTALTSGLPTIANSNARHGQGKEVKEVSDHMVALGMHLAAATIVFLVQAHLAAPK